VRSRIGVREGELDEDPSPTAELLRQLAVVEALWNAEYTAAQGRLLLRAPRGGAAEMGGGHRGRGRFKEGRPRSRRACPRRKAGVLSGDAVRTLREVAEGTDRRARAISETEQGWRG